MIASNFYVFKIFLCTCKLNGEKNAAPHDRSQIWEDHVSSEKILRRRKLEELESRLRRSRLRWFGHVKRDGGGEPLEERWRWKLVGEVLEEDQERGRGRALRRTRRSWQWRSMCRRTELSGGEPSHVKPHEKKMTKNEDDGNEFNIFMIFK